MRNVFLYGTLRHLPLLEAVLGRDVAPVAAELSDHAVARAEGRDFPILVAQSGARAAGVVLGVDEAGIARLDFYEGPFGYGLREVTVATADGPVAAWAYFPDPGVLQPAEAWDLAAWQAKWGTIVTRSADEVMATLGTQWAEAVDARHGMILARAQAYENTARWQRPRSLGRAMGRDRVRVTGQRHEHLGFFTLESLTMEHPRFDGGPPMEVTRAVFRAGEAVTLLPYDPVRDRVLLLEQFRAAPYAQGDPEPWLLEPIAGIVDAGESVEASAHREALEEAGITVGRLHFISRYYPSPGATAQVLHSYAGIADLPDGLATGGGLSDEGEDIAVHLVSFAEAMAMVESGEIAVAPLVISLQWLAANRERLRGSA